MADSKRRNRTDVLKESVKEKVDHYRNLARQQGLTTDDIDDCIMLALQAKRPTITKKVSQFWRKLAKVLIITAAILVFLVFIIANHKPSKRFVELLTYNTSYPLMRAVRLLSLPLARTVDLTGIYYSECTIPNPLFTGFNSVPDCYPCKFVNSIEIIEGTSSFFGLGRPFILKDPKINQFTYGEMQKWYRTNQKIFSLARADHVEFTNPFIHSMSDVFAEERREEGIEQSSFSLEWRAASAGSVRLIRNLCGKPSFIPSESEVFPEMFLIIESSSSYAHHLPKPAFLGYVWLSQAHGSREVVLSPVPTCKNNCTDISVVLEPGHVLFLDMRYWDLQSFPFGDSVSISCMGSFA